MTRKQKNTLLRIIVSAVLCVAAALLPLEGVTPVFPTSAGFLELDLYNCKL